MIHASDPLSAAGTKAQLAFQPLIEVLGPADYRRARVAVVVADRVDGALVKVVRALRCEGMPYVVVVATSFEESGVVAAAAAGVSGFLRRSEATSVRLVALIRDVELAGCQLPESLMKRAASMQVHPATQPPESFGFLDMSDDCAAGLDGDRRVSAREAEILRLVAEGYDTAAVAERLGFSESTIKAVLAKLMSRFEARNRCQVLAMVMREGLI
jgi:DNA-binding NarL/FixJ family response regulator